MPVRLAFKVTTLPLTRIPASVPFHAKRQRPPVRRIQQLPTIRSIPETSLPFHDSNSLPAGTLLTVRLKNPISAEIPDANLAFEAVVDEPVAVEGNQLVPRGADGFWSGGIDSGIQSKAQSWLCPPGSRFDSSVWGNSPDSNLQPFRTGKRRQCRSAARCKPANRGFDGPNSSRKRSPPHLPSQRVVYVAAGQRTRADR